MSGVWACLNIAGKPAEPRWSCHCLEPDILLLLVRKLNPIVLWIKLDNR